MSTSNIFNVELTKIAFKDKKVIVGNKAKKMENNKKALSLRFKNPQSAAESDIDNVVYVVAEVGGPLKKGASIVIDQGGDVSILNPEKTTELFNNLGTTRNEVLTAGARSIVDRVKSNPELMNALNLESNGPAFSANTLKVINEIKEKGQKAKVKANVELSLELPKEEVKEDSQKKVKRKGNKRTH